MGERALGRASGKDDVADDPEKVIAGVLEGAPRGQEGATLCVRGEELRTAGDLDLALACFDRALRYDVTLVPAWVGRSRILSAKKRDKEAFACINRALDVDPRHAPALVHKAEILRARGAHEEALAVYEMALGSGATGDAQSGRTASLAALGRPDVTRPVPKPSIPAPVEDRGPPSSRRRFDPRAEKKSIREDAKAPRKSVRTESRPDGKAITSDPLVSRKSDPAIALGDRSSSIPPKRPSIRMAGVAGPGGRRATQAEEDIATIDEVRGLVLANRHVEGLRKLEPVAQRLPAAREPWILRGHILFALKQYDAALATTERLLRLDPQDKEALVIMVRALTATNKDVRALEAAERLLALAPTDPDLHRLRADCLVTAMRHADAIVAYENLVRVITDDASLWFAYGRTLRQVRRMNDARVALTKAIALADANGDASLGAQARELLAKLPP